MPSAPSRLLLVEDEAIVAMNAEDVLERAGFRVTGSFDSCAEALSALREMTFDGAVLDVNLRDGTCLELARALRARQVPFVVYSVRRSDHADADLDGAPWVEKPAPIETVVGHLRAVIATAVA